MNRSNLGQERRLQILPEQEPSIDYIGPSYSPADELRTPGQIGITRDDTLSSVFRAISGVSYYTDMIGFGESSNAYSSGFPFDQLGVNYFMRTGQQCSNGADMYHYVQGIPKGDALGKGPSQALREMGLPGLRGLAPGMLEDTKEAMDPVPLMGAFFGNAYSSCKQVRQRVGDSRGRIQSREGERWIDGNVQYGNDGFYYQTRWVKDKSLNKRQYDCTPKIMKKDGTPRNQKDIPEVPDECYFEEGFTDMQSSLLKGAIATVAVCAGAYLIFNKLGKK